MGTATYTDRFDGSLSLAQVREKIADRAARDRHEMGYGHGFDGIRFEHSTDRKLNSIDAIHEYSEELYKGDGVIVRLASADIPYKERDALKPQQDALNAEAQKASRFATDVLTRMKGQASKTRGCQTCGSAVAVAYMKARTMRSGSPRTTLACPVCETEDAFITETDKKRRESLMAGYDRAMARYKEAEAKLAQKFKTEIWYVLGCNRD
jgi:hypothetical protein